MSDEYSITRSAVEHYLANGWSVVPIPKGEKGPRIENWQNRAFTLDDFGPGDNIGVRLGEPSGGLTDVDLDCREAILCARDLLLDTQCVSGRVEKPDSHYWFVALGSKSEQLKDTDGSVLCEIRSTGGQTVLPPSVHPSGDRYVWSISREPGKVDPDGLRETVVLVATAAIVARHYPAKGSRHIVARDLAGFLASRDIDPMLIELVVRCAATVAGDTEVEDRARVARDSAITFKAGNKTTGLPSLAQALGDDVIKRLRNWFGGANEGVVDEMNAKHFGCRVGSSEVIGTEDDDGEVVFQKPHDLAFRYRGDKVQVGSKNTKNGSTPVLRTKFDVWADSNRRRNYRKVVFKPYPRECDNRDYNLWRGFAVEPSPDASGAGCRLFLDHVRSIVCGGNEAFYEYTLDCCAHAVVWPGEPSEVVVSLRGKQGAGKGAFVRYFGRIFGPHFIQVDKTEDITGKFNGHLSAKVVVFADEAVWAGGKKDIGTLKRLVSEETMTIERKGIDKHAEDNCIHLFMATNEGWAAPVEFHDRRFFVLETLGVKRDNREYFAALDAEMRAGGPSALLAFLQARKVECKGLGMRRPESAELGRQAENKYPPFERWLKERLFEGSFVPYEHDWPSGRMLVVQHLYVDFRAFCRDHRFEEGLRLSEEHFGRLLRQYTPDEARPADGQRTRALAVPVRDRDSRESRFEKPASAGERQKLTVVRQCPKRADWIAQFEKQTGHRWERVQDVIVEPEFDLASAESEL